MFSEARIKLTLWYLAIILFISSTLSFGFYLKISGLIEEEYRRIETRQERVWQGRMPPEMRQDSPFARITGEDLDLIKKNIRRQIFLINGYIILFFGGAGYLLSGKTLEPIEKALEEQKRFVEDAAHELKTPVTALKTSLEVSLMDKKNDKKTKKLIKDNLEDVNRLEKLILRLLRLARQNGKKMNFERIEVGKIVDEVIRKMRVVANKKDVRILKRKIDKNIVIRADQNSFRELLIILIDNAIKYNKKGGKVWIEGVSKGKDVVIKIEDNGMGIESENLKKIFDRFYQADVSRTKNGDDGFGLGLAIAKKIVDEHRGSIKVSSKKNEGSKFEVKLPRAES